MNQYFKRLLRLLVPMFAGVGTVSVAPSGMAEAVWAPPHSVYTQWLSYTFSEPTSIDSMLHDFRGDIQSGEQAFTLNRIEFGVRFGSFQVGYGARYDYFLQFSEDLARAYHASQHNQDIDLATPQTILLKARHIGAHGPVLGFHWTPRSSWQLGLKLQYLQAERVVDGRTKGHLQVIDDAYNGTVDLRVDSSRDLLLDTAVPDPAGQGLTADLALNWRFHPDAAVSVEALDIWSRIHWDDILYSDLFVDTSAEVYDAQGNLQTRPILAGYQYLYSRTLRLPRKFRYHLAWMPHQHRFNLEHWHVPGLAQTTALGYQYELTRHLAMGGYWNVTTRAVGVLVDWRGLALQAGTDQLDDREQRVWELRLGMSLPLF